MLEAENRIYIQEGEIHKNGSFKILDKNNQAFPVPSSLFKYYALVDYNIEATINHYFYASDRWQLNDPFDCHMGLINFNNLKENERSMINESIPGTTYNKKLNAFFGSHFKRFGIVSLSKNACDKLMWAHYTGNKGYNIEFDTQKLNIEESKGIFPINYVNKLTSIQWNQGSSEEPFLYLTNIKFRDWIYENEWRIIAYKQDGMTVSLEEKSPKRNINYAIDAIKSVILGPLFFDLKTELSDDFLLVCPLKAKLLDFIIENNIAVKLVLNPEDRLHGEFSMDFKPSSINLQKIGENKYMF